MSMILLKQHNESVESYHLENIHIGEEIEYEYCSRRN
jgi:hypothetical protein